MPPPAPAVAPPAAATRPSTAGSRSLQTTSAAAWSVEQVGRWLGVLGLERYAAQFAAHEVSGAVLLDVTSEDLDFVGVPVLAHRKLLLRGVQQLREAAGVSGPAGSPLASSSAATPAPAAAPAPAPTAATAQTATVHWSRLQPLAAPKASSATDTALDASGTPYAIQQQQQQSGNSGGGGGVFDGTFDEEAQSAAFKAAVEAWRRGGAAAGTADVGRRGSGKESQQEAEEKEGADAGALWQNPFGGGGSFAAEKPALLSPAPRAVAPPPSKARSDPVPASVEDKDGMGTGGSLADGLLDEAAEAAAFREAVQAWRQGRPAAAEGAPGPTRSAGHPSETSEAGSSGLPALGPRLTCYQCFRQFAAAQAYAPSSAPATDDAGGHALCSEACFEASQSAALGALARREADGATLAMELARTERERDEAERILAGLRDALRAEEADEATRGQLAEASAVAEVPEPPHSGGLQSADIDSVAAAASLAASAMLTEKVGRARSATGTAPGAAHSVPAAIVSSEPTAPPIDLQAVDFSSFV